MTYDLAIGDRTYSSWSLRGWLLFSKFNLPVSVTKAQMYSDEFTNLVSQYAPARLVPAARLDGDLVFDTLAIAETLNERHPEAGMWPTNSGARAFARSITAEMHAGFGALRSDCTMNLRHCYPDYSPSDAVQADVKRIELLWELARRDYGAGGPWLFGEYSIADVFYAPVATRIATYSLPVGDIAADYVRNHLADETFRQWRARGIAENYVQPGYDLDLSPSTWPGPKRLDAKPVDAGPSENELCPYSNKPVTDFLELDGRIFGFCKPFCRDKTVADAAAWPDFVNLYGLM